MQEVIVFLEQLACGVILEDGYSVIPINLLDSFSKASLYLSLITDSI